MFLGVALIAALAGYFLNPLAREPKVDTGALATSLPDLQGQRRQIGEWRGKVLVVNFWDVSVQAICRSSGLPILNRTSAYSRKLTPDQLPGTGGQRRCHRVVAAGR